MMATHTQSPRQINANLAALLVLVSITAGFGGGWLGSRSSSQTQQAASTKAQRQIVETESQLISAIAKDVSPSVVSVNVTSQAVQQTIFGGQAFSQESAGTGIIISEDGYIITNRHVVSAGTTNVSVTLADGTKLDSVEVIGRTKDSDPLDVAFLKIKDTKGKKLVAAKIGDSSKAQVGERVIAIGNALGQFQNTVTSGIISGFGRSVQAGSEDGGSENLQDLFQTDAAINEGNSGGPLLNTSGEVIGINTAIAGDGAQNIGFSIPVNNVQGLIKSVLKKGKFERPYIGIRYVTLTDDFAYYYNLSVKRGAYIAPPVVSQSPIIAGSPAEKAGLKVKDIITKVDGVALDDTHSLTSLLGSHVVGDTVTLTVHRDGKEETIKVTLEAQP
jgi:serine protease Do